MLKALLSSAATVFSLSTVSMAEDCDSRTTLSYNSLESIEAVKTGEITATVRKGVRCYAAIIELVYSADETVHGKLNLISEAQINFSDIDDHLASKQGFASAAEAQSFLNDVIYPDVDLNTVPMTALEFSYVGE